jgi:hypothetical protein
MCLTGVRQDEVVGVEPIAHGSVLVRIVDESGFSIVA